MSLKRIVVVLYENYETLDVFGPVEVLGHLDNYQLEFVSFMGGIIKSTQKVEMVTKPFSEIEKIDILLIPGGRGAEILTSNVEFIEGIALLAKKSEYILTVCTGSVLLAKTGLLDNKKATSNKMAFEWVCSQREEVIWVKEARWVRSGNYYTSSGVSAGIDMALGFISDLYSMSFATYIARDMEYSWNPDKTIDEFFKYY